MGNSLILVEYGDEEAFIDPWQLFDEKAAAEYLKTAKRSLAVARKIYDFLQQERPLLRCNGGRGTAGFLA